MYENAVKAGRGLIMAALAQHSTPEPGRQIDTVKGIDRFSVLYFERGLVYSTGPYEGKRWAAFVLWWFHGGAFARSA